MVVRVDTAYTPYECRSSVPDGDDAVEPTQPYDNQPSRVYEAPCDEDKGDDNAVEGVATYLI